MAVTPNYGWPVPVATDYVKDGWEAISDLGNAIDTTVAGLGSGLTLITSQTIGTTVSTVTVSGCFSSSYKNYRIVLSGGVGSTNLGIRYQLNGITTGWYSAQFYVTFGNTSGTFGLTNSASALFGWGTTTGINAIMDLINPNAALPKMSIASYIEQGTSTGNAVSFHGASNVSTSQATDFIINTTTGTLTGGTIKIYGYED